MRFGTFNAYFVLCITLFVNISITEDPASNGKNGNNGNTTTIVGEQNYFLTEFSIHIFLYHNKIPDRDRSRNPFKHLALSFCVSS